MTYLARDFDLQEIANKIRARTGSADRLYFPTDFIESILSIGSGRDENAYVSGYTDDLTKEEICSLLERVAIAKGVKCKVYYNNTDETDEHGIPANSICAAIAGDNSGPAFGAIRELLPTYVETYGNTGLVTPEKTYYYQRVYVISNAVELTIEVEPLDGYKSSTTPNEIAAAVYGVTNKISIGDSLKISDVRAAAESVNPEGAPIFLMKKITAKKWGQTCTDEVTSGWSELLTFSVAVEEPVEEIIDDGGGEEVVYGP